MKKEELETPEQVTKKGVFDYQAIAGLTKHLGGQKATKELAKLCQIDSTSYVLDIGCGAGFTPTFLAKKFKCRVVGVDIHPEMVETSKALAKRRKVEDRTEFRVADAQNLPFDDNTFDVVLNESVFAFALDKKQAINEYVRVIKPGGVIGINDSVWVKTPPQEYLEYISTHQSGGLNPIFPSELKELFEGAGLEIIEEKTSKVKALNEAISILRRQGLRELTRSVLRMLSLYRKDPDYRQFVKDTKDAQAPRELSKYIGFTIIVGRKEG
ncbi:MAG: class I SAM-dependent methyltransferase [Promethearchaeota archaeon]